jgi:hypothetical protein
MTLPTIKEDSGWGINFDVGRNEIFIQSPFVLLFEISYQLAYLLLSNLRNVLNLCSNVAQSL